MLRAKSMRRIGGTMCIFRTPKNCAGFHWKNGPPSWSCTLGNFELGGFFLGVLGFPTHSVARTLDNPYLDAFVNRFRGTTGQQIVPKRGGLNKSPPCWMRRNDDVFGGSIRWQQRLLYRILRPTSLGPQGHRVVLVRQRRSNGGRVDPGLNRPMHFVLCRHGVYDPRIAQLR